MSRPNIQAVALALVLAATPSAFGIDIRKQWMSTSFVELLRERQVSDAVQLSDDQLEEVEQLENAVKAELGRLTTEVLRSREDQRAKVRRIKEIVASRHVKEESELQSILLHHQFATLKAIWRQREIKRRGVADVLIDSKYELRLSQSQVEDLRDLDEMAKEEREKTLRRLEKEATDRLLSTLTEQQRNAWFELLQKTREVPPEEDL